MFLRLFSKARREDGNALVIVVSSIFLIGISLTLMMSSTLAGTARATESRAHAQSVAIAEGGIEEVAARTLKTNVCATHDASSSLDYSVLVESREGSGAFVECAPGTQLSDMTTEIRVRAIGHATSKTRQKDKANSAEVERVFKRSISSKVYAAIRTAGTFSPSNGGITLPEPADGAAPGDVITHGKFTCGSGTSEYSGNIFALGGFQQNNSCLFKQNLYIVADQQAKTSETVTVEGDLIVKGDFHVSNKIIVKGKTLITGNLSITSTNSVFHGPLRVIGNLSDTNGVTYNDTVSVRGNYSPAYALSTYKSNVYVAGRYLGTNGAALQNLTGNLYVGAAQSTHVMSAHDWGNFSSKWAGKYEFSSGVANSATIGENWELPDEFDPEFQKQNDFDFPLITKNDAMFSGWDVWTQQEFKSRTGFDACNMNTNQVVKIHIAVNMATKIDLSSCVWNWGWSPTLEVVSDYDVAFIVGGFDQGGGNSSKFIMRSKNDPDTLPRRPRLYLIDPVTIPYTCKPPGNGNSQKGIRFVNLQVKQTGFDADLNSPKVSMEMVLYSGRDIEIGGLVIDKFHAQVMGCNVSSWGSLKLFYSPDPNEIAYVYSPFVTQWTRDLTN